MHVISRDPKGTLLLSQLTCLVENTPIVVDPLQDYVSNGAMYPTKRCSNYAILYDDGHAYAYLPKNKTDKDLIDLSIVISNMEKILISSEN